MEQCIKELQYLIALLVDSFQKHSEQFLLTIHLQEEFNHNLGGIYPL